MKTMEATTSEFGACLRGKVAVVTGAARGIGRATAVAFAREGADLVGIDIGAPVDPRSGVQPANTDELKETGRLVEATGRRWMGRVLDQRDLPALRACAAEAQQVFGGIDILFANAGIPGLIDTPLTRHEERYAQAISDGGRSPTGSDEAEARRTLAARTPLGVPWIEPEDVAPVVVFLASDAARMVSGATYDVTAGDSARNTA